jgi:DNA-binding FadR family transcriptional regulator
MPTPAAKPRQACGQEDRVVARPGALAARVARRIEDEVIRAGWPVGRNLGSEQDLQDRHGVSRAVLREAIRLVEHHQVARMRRGPGGGLLVTAPDVAPTTRAMVIYLDYVGTSPADLVEARLLLEPRAAALAAERLTEGGVERLRAALREEERRREEPGIWSQDPLHVLLGELSGNPALHAFIEILTRLTIRYAHTARHTPKAEAVRAKRTAGLHHAQIVEAAVAGDAGQAQSLITSHLTETAAWLESHRAGDRPGRGGTVSPQLIESPGAKLGEVIASRIHHRIAADGWLAGAALGSETELLERYDISRAVLREAVRLLEYHGVARMRRGPGGGLMVTTPDPAASIETMALYLEYRRAGAADLLAVREAVEMGALATVTARRKESGVAGRPGGAAGDGGAPPDVFHSEIAELAGNPVLILFLRILTELWRRHTTTQVPALPGAEAATEIEGVHRHILEAVLAGDASLARHRMRRHLAVLTEWWH